MGATIDQTQQVVRYLQSKIGDKALLCGECNTVLNHNNFSPCCMMETDLPNMQPIGNLFFHYMQRICPNCGSAKLFYWPVVSQPI